MSDRLHRHEVKCISCVHLPPVRVAASPDFEVQRSRKVAKPIRRSRLSGPHRVNFHRTLPDRFFRIALSDLYGSFWAKWSDRYDHVLEYSVDDSGDVNDDDDDAE